MSIRNGNTKDGNIENILSSLFIKKRFGGGNEHEIPGDERVGEGEKLDEGVAKIYKLTGVRVIPVLLGYYMPHSKLVPPRGEKKLGVENEFEPRPQ